MRKFQTKSVADLFASYPEGCRKKLLFVRSLIFDIAAEIEEVGSIEETVKWGEPSYLTSETGSGSTIRLAWKKKNPECCGIYFNCKTTLIDTFRNLYGDLFHYEGKRALLFHEGDELPEKELSHCIALALTYHIGFAERTFSNQ